MPRKPFVLTAQQYAECWSDRIESEQGALAKMVKQEKEKQETVQAAAAERRAAAEEAAAVASASAAASGHPGSQRVQMLEAQLMQERAKREQLESLIALAHSQRGRS